MFQAFHLLRVTLIYLQGVLPMNMLTPAKHQHVYQRKSLCGFYSLQSLYCLKKWSTGIIILIHG